MTTKHDSFDASPHGFFVESPHGFRNAPGTKVLFTGTRNFASVLTAHSAPWRTFYEGLNATFDATLDVESIDEYDLIFYTPWGIGTTDDPPDAWLSQLLPVWSGRIVFLARVSSGQQTVVTGDRVINALTSLTGISCLSGFTETVRGVVAVLAHSLTSGMNRGMLRDFRNAVFTGGSSLVSGTLRFAVENTIGGVSYVAHGSGLLSVSNDFGFGQSVIDDAKTFAANLLNISVGG